jgi:hypothetical protein
LSTAKQKKNTAVLGVMPETTKDIAPPKVSKRVVVESPDGIRNDQTVMLRVDMSIEEFVLVHVAVHKVLPCTHHQHCNQELEHLNDHRWLDYTR